MKKLEIVIRPESLENLELLLEEQKANGMMITNILGYGNQKGYRQMYRGAEIVAKMLPKVKVETVVEDDKVPKIVDFPSLSEPAPVQLLIFPAADFFFIRLPGFLFHSFTGSAASI